MPTRNRASANTSSTAPSLSALLTGGVTPAYEPFESFLLGYPDSTSLPRSGNPTTNSIPGPYAFFAQDDWKVSSRLTINYGLRWEYHPMLKDHLNNIEELPDPDYNSIVNGQPVHGAVIVPNQEALQQRRQSGFCASISPIPILTAAQVGLSSSYALFAEDRLFAPHRDRMEAVQQQSHCYPGRVRPVH